MVAPSVNYCFSGGELPGTVNVSPNTFGLLISEICSEFIRMGFENIVFFLGHAGTDNLNALKNTLQQDEICMDEEYYSRMMRTDQDWFEKREKAMNHPFIVEKVGQRDEVKVGVMGYM